MSEKNLQRGALTKAQQSELDRLAEANGGLLNPERIVEFARNPKSALHSRFTWSDSAAAAKWRLQEARQTITFYVTVVAGSSEPVRAFVSLQRDRTGDEEGGYRRIESVMSDADMRKELLGMALKDMEAFQRRYARLRELEQVFAAMRKVRAGRKK